MSFWNTSDGEQIKSTTEFELGGSSEPIPDNTNLKACIDEAGWKEFEGDEYIELRWTVLDGPFKNRKVFQKLRVMDAETKKSDKAKRMLAAIDANCGGNLMKNTEGAPSDQALMTNLCNKPMVIKVFVWEMNDKTGNWVGKVSSANTPVEEPKPEVDTEDDIPF